MQRYHALKAVDEVVTLVTARGKPKIFMEPNPAIAVDSLRSLLAHYTIELAFFNLSCSSLK